MIFRILSENKGEKREFQLPVGAGFCVFVGLAREIGKENRAGYDISNATSS